MVIYILPDDRLHKLVDVRHLITELYAGRFRHTEYVRSERDTSMLDFAGGSLSGMVGARQTTASR
jgi:hypothetical protein